MSHISLTYHIIWRTKSSRRTISEEHERDLYAYILGLCKEKNCYLYRVNSMPDHVHICVEIHPTISLSEFMQVIKQSTSVWMRDNHDKFPDFEGWGNGYAAFTYSVKERINVVNYIKNQKIHHQRISFQEEYEAMMAEFGLDTSKDLFLKD